MPSGCRVTSAIASGGRADGTRLQDYHLLDGFQDCVIPKRVFIDVWWEDLQDAAARAQHWPHKADSTGSQGAVRMGPMTAGQSVPMD